ncbi:arginine--tRNA ligase [Paramaledivibacter caminithermalis]|jgi:arginyl-tRNA synthetase|uniref:Arginine--tRNA ligase n=1 Tax=Paramaledivibacter caminithermalis (strain DSM 15212 / CIP 107654 / DViRD3) TaxID=1121301 RepID=A0A1M6SZ28_PARC5|nr:arginine--tRNA ligase [Paramaledivibacter caminithermalis]SHK50022.1 arginyl-tRNA synthetase [Paramaledivibacter caminithermalis DSM 15212]
MIDFKKEIANILNEKISELDFEEIYSMIEIPPNSDMGDFAFPCFKLAKIFRKAPNLIAKDINESIEEKDLFEDIETVGAYINFTINKKTFAKTVIEEVLNKKDMFGASNIGEQKNVIVEFSSPNIAKPFHIGHIRTTVIGSAINNIYKFLGYNAIAINHLGDYGTQFGKLIVAIKAWGDKSIIESNPIPELLKLYIKFHEEAEKNPQIEDEARMWFKKLEDNDDEATELWQWIRDVSLMEFNRVYDMLGIKFDSFAGESFYSDKMPAVLEEMREKNLMKKSEGAEIVDLEPYGMPPALITKKDGSTLYITRDIAAAIYRKKHYDFYKNIYVVGSQQNLHFKQWIKIIDLMGYNWAEDCIHVPFGMISLEEGTMSTRKGRVVFLEDVLNKAVEKTKEIISQKNPNLEDKEKVAKEVGIGAVIFQELANNRIKDYVFSWDRTLNFDGESGPYVQYTHARAASLLRKSQLDYKSNINFGLLKEKEAMDLIRIINKFPDVIVDAARKYEPAVITRYIIDVAQAFNRFYHEHSILVDDEELQKARLALVFACKQTIKNGLKLIGIAAPERM